MIKLEFTKEEVAALISSCETSETLFAMLPFVPGTPEDLTKLVRASVSSALGKLRVANLLAAGKGRSSDPVLEADSLEEAD